MKLSPLLAQFLQTNRELRLAGIGRFRVEASGLTLTDEQLKNTKGQLPGKIIFEQDVTVKDDENLVSFISAQTGKMKSLAAADLDSHMELARQFLNIGKPFLLEGIGTLVKNKSGIYEFTQGIQQPEKIKDLSSGESQTSYSTEDSFTDYEEMFSPKKPSGVSGKKIILWISIFAGIGLAIWGGYKVYNNSTGNANREEQKETTATVPADTLIKTETITQTKPAFDTTRYRYVIEESGRERALRRFSDLKSYGLNVLMETRDSVRFKIYFIIPSTPADTARIRDSLTLLYGTLGRTRVENLY